MVRNHLAGGQVGPLRQRHLRRTPSRKKSPCPAATKAGAGRTPGRVTVGELYDVVRPRHELILYQPAMPNTSSGVTTIPIGGIKCFGVCRHYSIGLSGHSTITITKTLMLDIVRTVGKNPQTVNHAQCTLCRYEKRNPRNIVFMIGFVTWGFLWADRAVQTKVCIFATNIMHQRSLVDCELIGDSFATSQLATYWKTQTFTNQRRDVVCK